MTDDIISTLRHHYAIAGTEPTHPVRRAIEEIERLRALLAEAQHTVQSASLHAQIAEALGTQNSSVRGESPQVES